MHLMSETRYGDYVNASWIKAGKFRVICAQSPLPNTVEHFLQMIQENGVSIIVTLTRENEHDADGIGINYSICSFNMDNMLSIHYLGTHKYWPDEEDVRISFGSAYIRKLSEHQVPEVPGLIKRRLEVLTEGMQAWHVVNQYHFTRWQDRNLQPKAKHILSLCSMVNANLERSNGVCVVHCNDSIGRSGVFIGLMRLTKQIDTSPDDVDICQTVFDMRTCRMKMVRENIDAR